MTLVVGEENKLHNVLHTCALNMYGWVTCDFTSCSTVFQLHRDDGWVIMKGCVQWNPVYD